MDLRKFIEDYPDFPDKGILFRDITPLLRNRKAFKEAANRIIDDILWDTKSIDLVVSPESRGFVFGTPIAFKLGIGFVPARKPGKLPGDVISQEYSLEYGENSIEISKSAINPGNKVVIVDDLLATGGTIKAIIDLVEKLGGKVVHIATLIELEALKGRQFLEGYNVTSVIKY